MTAIVDRRVDNSRESDGVSAFKKVRTGISRDNRVLVSLVLVFFLIAVDRVTAGVAMILGSGSCNSGVSFGWFSGAPEWAWAVIALPVVLFFTLMVLRNSTPEGMRWGVYIFFSGAVSNVLSRVLYGCVWDWLGVDILGIKFTLADVYIDAGLLLVLLGVFFSLRDNEIR